MMLMLLYVRICPVFDEACIIDHYFTINFCETDLKLYCLKFYINKGNNHSVNLISVNYRKEKCPFRSS